MLLGNFRLEASSAGVILQSTSETSKNGKPQSISSEAGVSEPHSSPIATAAHTKKVYSYFLYPEIWEALILFLLNILKWENKIIHSSSLRDVRTFFDLYLVNAFIFSSFLMKI